MSLGNTGAADGDTASLARAERLRQRPPHGYQGAAGSGAPRSQAVQQDAFPAQLEMPGLPPRAPGLPPRSPPRSPPRAPGLPPRVPSRERDAFPAQLEAPCADPVASELTHDPDAQERADLIEKCLAHGLTDEEIEGVLREHMFQKMVEQEEKEREEREKAPTLSNSSVAARLIAKSQESLPPEYQKELAQAPQEAPPSPPSFKPRSSSVAAKRQAKAASLKSVSFVPSDEEIVGILTDDHVRRTPSPQMGEPASAPTKPATDAAAAYLQSKQQAAASKNRNRNGSTIF